MPTKTAPRYRTYLRFHSGKGGPQEAPTDSHTTGDEFDRFKDLAGKLTKVPKSEVDAKRKKS